MKKQKILFTLAVAMTISAATPITNVFASTNSSTTISMDKIDNKDAFSDHLFEINSTLNEIIDKTSDSDLSSLLNNNIIKNYLPLREFISRVGKSKLTYFCDEDQSQKDFINCLIGNPTALTLYL